MKIIKRLALGWENEDGYGKYQYIYEGKTGRISLVYLECPRGKFMWETHSLCESSEKFSSRFDTKEEAEEFIMESIVGNELGALIEWRIAKQNMVIVEC